MNLTDDLLSNIQSLPEKEKLKVLKFILLEFVDTHPQQEIAVFDDQGEVRVWCVPTAMYRPYVPPEKLAEMKRRAANPGPRLSVAEMFAKLDELAKEKERQSQSAAS